ncbi:MAG: glycosyltransferase family 2 protein [Bacteroidales bacterium]|nr:glycosyltransferase family 2 protein [Bacteroidales bacterium]
MQIAVVLLNYNGAKWLKKFLPVVIERSKNACIYVIDNGSQDESLTYLGSFAEIEVIELDRNYGYAGGYNRGLKKVKEELAVLLNTDIEPAENWLQPLIKFMNGHPDYAACQPKILSYERKSYFEYAGAAGGMLDRYGIPFCRGRIFSTVEEDRGQYDQYVDIFWASGAALCIRVKDFFEVGAFDERFVAHQEEIDLCWRFWLRGKKVGFIPDSIVYHVGGGTLPYNSPRKVYLNIRNNLLMLSKNLPQREQKKIFFIKWCIDMLIFLMYVFQGKFVHATQIIKARKDARKMKKFSLSYLNSEHYPDMVFRKSVLWLYFIKRKKFFYQMTD